MPCMSMAPGPAWSEREHSSTPQPRADPEQKFTKVMKLELMGLKAAYGLVNIIYRRMLVKAIADMNASHWPKDLGFRFRTSVLIPKPSSWRSKMGLSLQMFPERNISARR